MAITARILTMGSCRRLAARTGPGVLLGSTADVYGGNAFPTVHTMSLAVSGIQSIKFVGGSTDFPHSVFYDNITVTAVPESGSLAMMAGGVFPFGAIALFRRRGRRA